MNSKVWIFLVIWSSLVGAGFCEESVGKAASLKLVISSEEGNTLTNGLKHLRATFTNVSNEQVRILREFRERPILPIWFHVIAKSADGKSTMSKWPTKVQLRRQSEYVVLDANESFGLRLNMVDLAFDLSPGTYYIRVIYTNNYGEDCFKGVLESDSIELIIK